MALDYSNFKATAEQDKLFDVAPFDPAKGREKLVARITRSLRQVNKEIGLQGGKDFEVGHNNQLRFKPTLNGQRIFVESEGEAYFPVSVSQFGAFITEMGRQVAAGKYDDQIEAALAASASSVTPAKATSATKAAGTRNVSTQSALNIGVAAKRRAKDPMTFDQIKKHYVAEGSDPGQVDLAIAKRKAAEGK